MPVVLGEINAIKAVDESCSGKFFRKTVVGDSFFE